MSLIRLNKYMAEKGLSTRRGADILIARGDVSINGKRAIIGQKVSDIDVIVVRQDKQPKYRYILYYKPRGVVTHSPDEGDRDIKSQIAKDHKMRDLFPIGRLDKDSEGLIILTNDGRITDRVLNPHYAHERTYEVVVDKRITQTFLNRLSRGLMIEGYKTKPCRAVQSNQNEYQFEITLTEGKKHQIRRMCAAGGYQVQQLKRTKLLTCELRNLKPGMYHELTPKEQKHFLTLLNLPL